MKFASFRTTLMTTICLICLVTVLLAGSLWMYTAQERIKADAQDSALEDAHIAARGVRAYSEKIALAADVVAGDPLFVGAVKATDNRTVRPMVDSLGARVPEAEFVQAADANGTVIYSTKPAGVTDLNTYSWYGAVARDGQPSVAGPYYSTVSGNNVLTVVNPVKDGDRVIGHVVTGLRPGAFMDAIALPAGPEASSLLIVDGGGRIVSRDAGTPLETSTNVSAYTPVRMALGGHDGVAKHNDSWDGQERISAYAPVPGLGWGVVASEPVGAVNARADGLRAIVGATVGLLALGFTAFGYYASKNLSDPIAELARKAGKVSAGGYDTVLDVPRDGELGGIARAINDMKAELKLKEARARDRDEQLHLLLRDHPSGVLITGANGEYQGCNAALLALFGVTEDELVDANIFSDDWVLWGFFREGGGAMPRESNPIFLVYATRRPLRDVTTEVYRPATGTRAWLKISAVPHLEADGSVKRVICTFDDDTERRRLEESVRLARFSIDSSPEEILWITADGRLCRVNDAVCDRLGYAREELLSMSIWDIDAGFTRDGWAARWDELKRLGRSGFRSEHRASDGTTFPTSVSLHYVRHRDQERAIAFVRDIGELRRVEEDLATIGADLARVLAAAKAGTWQWDARGDRFRWSAGTPDVLGVAPGESPGTRAEYLRLVHPGDRAAVGRAIDEALADGDRFRSDHRLAAAGGPVRHVHLEGEVVRDDAGAAVRLIGTVQDVTGLRLVEIARDDLQGRLEFENARLEAVLRNIPAGIVIAEAPSGRILMANRQMEEIFRDKFPASPDVDAYGEWGVFQSNGRRYDPEDIPLARSIRRQEEVRGEELHFLRGDGTWGLISINSAPIFDRGGHAINAIATFFDITESKQAENALRESESNLAKAQRIAHLGNWVWNIQTNEMRYSDELRQIYGLGGGGHPGAAASSGPATFDDFMRSICPDDRGGVRRSINAALNRKEPHSIDFRVRRPDGTVRIVHSEGEIVFDDAGKPIRLFGTVQDISDRKQVELALREAKMQAELYLDLMSHDINNMNQIGMGYLELARSRLDLAPGDRELLYKPEEVLRNSSVLIDNVRKTRKAITGELKLGPVDAGLLLEELKAKYADGRDVAIVAEGLQRAGAYVVANDLLKDVFANLLDNAVKHTEKPVTIGIGLSRVEEGDRMYYRVYVEDSGPGIPDEQKGHIFERMRRGNTQARGTGLGLYLVKTLVDSYGGKVWVEDRVPDDYRKGSRFVVMLPAV